MPLSRARMRERKRQDRQTHVKPLNEQERRLADCVVSIIVKPGSLEEVALDPIHNPSKYLPPVKPNEAMSNLVKPNRAVAEFGLTGGGFDFVGDPPEQVVQPTTLPIEVFTVWASEERPVEIIEEVQPYDPAKHYEPGDKFLVKRSKRMIETTVPSVDLDGNPYD